MATKTGELREILMKSIDHVIAGKLDSVNATAVAKLAAQINHSMQVEINARIEDEKLRKTKFGSVPIGEEESQN